jgi:hypothetical protein
MKLLLYDLAILEDVMTSSHSHHLSAFLGILKGGVGKEADV